jgi:hypothetical protein
MFQHPNEMLDCGGASLALSSLDSSHWSLEWSLGYRGVPSMSSYSLHRFVVACCSVLAGGTSQNRGADGPEGPYGPGLLKAGVP